MTREQAYAATLDAIAKIQWDVSVMLGAQAVESEKARNWLLEHVKEHTFQAHSDRLDVCLHIHEQQIEVIDGLTKMCDGLSRNMKVILHPGQEDGGGGGSMPGGFGPDGHGE